MARHTVWQCDHCNETLTQVIMPEGWVTAKIDQSRNFGAPNDIVKEWCSRCWSNFKMRQPEFKSKQATPPEAQ